MRCRARRAVRGWIGDASAIAAGFIRAAAAPLVLLAPLLSGCAAPVPTIARNAYATRGEGEIVVLVHGLGRTRFSMLPMERALERDGFRVLNWGYSSTSAAIPELGATLAERIRAEASTAPAVRVHFVGHSLGNIIIRWVLANDPPATLGRIVMLAPPNQGARSADRYVPVLGWLLRPLPELGTAETSTARTLPTPPGAEIGVIAGDRDSKVVVAETHLPGADHTVVPSRHTFIMAHARVHRLTTRFLRNGRFTPAAAYPDSSKNSRG